jgi:hypothetical protein
VIDDFAKAYLQDELMWVREAVVAKLEGLSEYDVRRPLTVTGTNLLGLVKHLSLTEARYFSEVFGRPSPWPLHRWDSDEARSGDDMWAAEHESRVEIVDRYRLAWEFTDTAVAALPIDAPGQVPWWPRPEVKLFNIMVHVLTETSRHAGHADILREELDGRVGNGPYDKVLHGNDAAYWADRRATIEQAARAVSEGQ